MQKLSMIALGPVCVSVYLNAEFDEYVVKLSVHGLPLDGADYFTDDLADAGRTALSMLEQASRQHARACAGPADYDHWTATNPDVYPDRAYLFDEVDFANPDSLI